jgi:hypothetical protein
MTVYPIVLFGARDPRYRVTIRGVRFVARRQPGHGISMLFGVAGLRAIAGMFAGKPVYEGHAWTDSTVEDLDGAHERVSLGPTTYHGRRPLIGWVRGPVTWDDSAWELCALVEPAGPRGARRLAYGYKHGWGFSAVTRAYRGRWASDGAMSVECLELFTEAVSADLVPVASAGGRFLGVYNA